MVLLARHVFPPLFLASVAYSASDLSLDLVHYQQVPQRIRSNCEFRWVVVRSSPVTTGYQVFDNYAVTVMIGDDPYTLGLFDTAGACIPEAQL